MRAMSDAHFATLPDGRRVCFAAHGDPEGWPVFLFHGTPASRLGHEFADASATEIGVRVICPDRPGIGQSDPKPERTIASYAQDVRDVALALGIPRYSVAGYSGGGPYALACGAGTPDAVHAVALMAGVGPTTTPRGLDGLAKSDVQMLKLATGRPAAARALMRVLVRGARLAPKVAVKSFRNELSEVDQEAIDAQEPKAIMAFFVEASHQGPAGPVEDYRLWGGDWGFPLGAVAVPVHVWQGDADQMVPMHHALWMAEQLPDATLHRLPGEGHVSIQRHVGAVLESVKPS